MSKTKKVCNGIMGVDQDVIDSLEYNGTYLPNAEKITFNLKTEEKVVVKDADGNPKRTEVKIKDGKTVMKNVYETVKLEKPILTTRVVFDDGTSVIVKNSEHDPVETEEVDVGGTKVTVASHASKERGIAYAILKRACGVVGEKNIIDGNGLGRILNDLVAEGYDQQFEEAKAKAEKAARKTAETAKPKKAKAKRYSYSELAQLAGPILEALCKKAQEEPGFIKKLLGA